MRSRKWVWIRNLMDVLSDWRIGWTSVTRRPLDYRELKETTSTYRRQHSIHTARRGRAGGERCESECKLGQEWDTNGEEITTEKKNFPLPLLILILFCVSGEKGTLTHGSVLEGRFEGFIKTHQGTYYVEPSERYLKDTNVPFHSVIYHEDDVSKYAHTCHCTGPERF